MTMAMVILGSAIVSPQKRVILSFAVTAVIVPVLPPMPAVDMVSFEGWMITVQQVMIGITVGFVSRLIFETFVIGGQIVAMTSGLGFAEINDPSSGVAVPVVGQFFLMMATLTFLALDGHLMLIDTIVKSFYSLPVSTEGISMAALSGIFTMAGNMFVVGLKMALAAVISLLMVNLSFGILTKVAPTLNIFVIGFPMILTFGLLILWFTINGFGEYFDLQMLNGMELTCNLVNLECVNG
jgi:flagellar biosynthetic protein FliR